MPEQERRVVIELERSYDCHEAQWHTRHDETKYDRYEHKFVDALKNIAGDHDYVYVKNPGPKAHGMHCKQSPYNKKLYSSMIKNDKTQRWYPDVTFCYPRVGSFEVTAVKGKQRVPVFSKLAVRKWPQPEWLAAKVEEVVTSKMGGWKAIEPVVKVERKYATKKMTDDELRNLMKKKFSTLIGAFRAFDKNGDGCISKSEFMTGLRQTGIDLPKEQLEKLWKMADEDGTGNLQYQEFARKFATYKATGSLHRHTDFKDGEQKNIMSLHGCNATSRVQKHAAIRGSENLDWGVGDDKLAENPDEVIQQLNSQDMGIAAIARDTKQMAVPIEEMNHNQVRAKIYQKHGSVLNAFRHFDFDGSSSIDYEEFMRHLPTVLGEPISQLKMESLWRAYDPDLSGSITLDEFASDKCSKVEGLSTSQGVSTFKGQAVDPTLKHAHSTTKGAMVVEKTYGRDGAHSQIIDKAGKTRAGSPTDASTAAGSPTEDKPAVEVVA